MLPSLALLAVALAAEPAASAEAPPERVLYAIVVPRELTVPAGAADQLDALMLNALPDPPAVVVRTTHYYGTITIDHRAHLARRNPCKGCHGSGMITKLDFTPRVAHERCVGCHTAQAKGPTRCSGCHVRPPPEPVPIVTAAMTTAAPVASGPNPANLAAALAAFDAPARQAMGLMADVRDPFHRWFEVGVAAGAGQGFSFRLASHQDGFMFTQSVDYMSHGSTGRTLGLLGVGVSRPVMPRLSVQALGVAGVDVFDRPIVAFLPAIGLRAGIEWRPQRFRFLRQVTASFNTVFDISHTAFGRDVGGVAIYGTLATGFGGP